MPRLPWRSLLVWSLAPTVLVAGYALWDLSTTRDTLGGLVVTGPQVPGAEVLRAELGDDAVNEAGKHDGAFFYAIARDPFSPGTAAAGLDGPRYRLQRIAFPLAAWVLHPTGGGVGLEWAMFAVGVASILGGSLATGALSVTLRGPPWPAALFAAAVGSFISLRISVPDPMALGLAVAAIVLVLRGHLVAALVAAVAAGLTREVILVVFAGWLLSRRDRDALVLFAVPSLVVAAWGAYLLRAVAPGETTVNFGPPFVGVVDSFRFWFQGHEPLGLVGFLLGVGVGIAGLARRGLRHPLAGAVLASLAFLVPLTASVLAPERNANRMVMPVFVLGIVMLVTPTDALPPPPPWRAVLGRPGRRARVSG
ncbi:MAG: hypothetical protein R2726_20160 [Acidimicrobiales bacterium]